MSYEKHYIATSKMLENNSSGAFAIIGLISADENEHEKKTSDYLFVEL